MSRGDRHDDNESKGRRHQERSRRRSYHHGNLREALISAALDLIASKGAAGFTFAEAARAAGVSPAAPYRHFKDRDQLMEDVARRGFDEFGAALRDAWNDGQPNAYRAFHAVGNAYLKFARSQPALYTAMFEAGVPHNANAELARASEAAFAVLRQATETLVSTLPADKRPPVGMMNFHIWSLSHGIADLFARGDGTRRKLPMSPEDLLEAGVLIYLRGLGITDGPPES